MASPYCRRIQKLQLELLRGGTERETKTENTAMNHTQLLLESPFGPIKLAVDTNFNPQTLTEKAVLGARYVCKASLGKVDSRHLIGMTRMY